MLCDDDIDNVASSSLYKMLETYLVETMLKDITGHFWVHRARAAVTRHRFITVDDQEKYYMQKYFHYLQMMMLLYIHDHHGFKLQ